MNIKFKLIAHLTILSLIFLSTASHGKSFEIPRSKVVKMQDSATKRFYELHIQLPLDFIEGKKYPVVYMMDSLYTFPIISGSIQLPIMFHKMENLMLVGISWETGYNPYYSRQRDYTPTNIDQNSKHLTGQANKHLLFITNDVIKYIEKKYSTDPEQRTFVGHSFGGLFGAYIFLTEPKTFKNYILSSPSFWWDDKYILKLEAETAKTTSDIDAHVFISDGALESEMMTGIAKEFSTQLESRNYKKLSLKLAVIQSANHETAFPATAMQGLSWLFEPKIQN